ncbi:MAG: DNA methyltransferase [Candidatus Micrarchaeia archaeon]
METKHSVIIGDSRNMADLADESVQLIVTSPPYFNVKNYGNVKGNIGAIDDYMGYLQSMEAVFRECFRVLQVGRYCCVNISDIISNGRKYPIPFHFVFLLERAGFTYRDNLIWKKPDGMGSALQRGHSGREAGCFQRGSFSKSQQAHRRLEVRANCRWHNELQEGIQGKARAADDVRCRE